MCDIMMIKGGDIMAGICTLAPDINSCPHYNQKEGACVEGPEQCGFYVKEDDKLHTEQEYTRKPRWYEEFLR